LATNTAGELRVGSGSEIVAAIQTKQQVVVFTDRSVSAMQYIGPPFTFGLAEVSTNTSILGQNAAVAVGDAVYWMGNDVFYRYDGNVSIIPCPVEEFVFDNVNTSQLSKVTAGSNSDLMRSGGSTHLLIVKPTTDMSPLNYSDSTWFFGLWTGLLGTQGACLGSLSLHLLTATSTSKRTVYQTGALTRQARLTVLLNPVALMLETAISLCR